MLSLWFRALSPYICGGLLFVSLILGLSLAVEKRHSRHLQDQVISLSAELKRISAERANQKSQTSERIKVAAKTIHDADGRAKAIEQAPLPGGCKSPPEVLGADL